MLTLTATFSPCTEVLFKQVAQPLRSASSTVAQRRAASQVVRSALFISFPSLFQSLDVIVSRLRTLLVKLRSVLPNAINLLVESFAFGGVGLFRVVCVNLSAVLLAFADVGVFGQGVCRVAHLVFNPALLGDVTAALLGFLREGWADTAFSIADYAIVLLIPLAASVPLEPEFINVDVGCIGDE